MKGCVPEVMFDGNSKDDQSFNRVESKQSMIQVKGLESETLITQNYASFRVIRNQLCKPKDICCNAKNIKQ